MNDFVRRLEEERRKLNELGNQSLKQSIPLSDNQDVLEQSREVDDWMVCYYLKARRKQEAR